MPSTTELVNWQAVLERLSEDVDRLYAAHQESPELAAALLAGVGRTPPPAGSAMPPELRPQAEAVLARMHELERLLAAATLRLGREARDEPDTPAFYLDTTA